MNSEEVLKVMEELERMRSSLPLEADEQIQALLRRLGKATAEAVT